MVSKRDRRILLWIVALSLLALAAGLPAGSALAGKVADTTFGIVLKPAAPSTSLIGPSAPNTSTPTFTRTPTSTSTITNTPTDTPTITPTNTPTNTPTITPTFTDTPTTTTTNTPTD